MDLADIVRLLISAFVLGLVIFIIRKVEPTVLGFLPAMPEAVAKYKIPEIAFALVLILFGGKIHKLIPEAGMVILAVTFAELIEENLKL